MLPNAKPRPTPRATVKRANKRVEAKLVRQVRAACVARDGHCRLGARFWRDEYMQRVWNSNCAGPSEWAHLNEFERSKTRGKAPEERHTTHGSCMLCRFHHAQLHAKTLTVEFLTDRGADGPLAWRRT